ncbi:MAG: hypothetical protein BWY91_02921 [bacterium ADurb.BinA028]|nr:MAG: hypothetical protein BWY91_02921 [bacterium ADurb.BinA028]
MAAGNGAGQVARLVRECKRPDLTTVQAAAVSGFVSVPVALTVVSEFARLKPRLREEAAPTVLQGLLDMGIADGPRGSDHYDRLYWPRMVPTVSSRPTPTPPNG